MLSGPMPPTGNSSVALGSTARQALSTGGRQLLGRKQLESVGPGGERGERLGRRRDPGDADEAQALGLGDDLRIAMRHHDQPPAGVGHARDVGDVEHGARADEAALAEALGQHPDRCRAAAAS